MEREKEDGEEAPCKDKRQMESNMLNEDGKRKGSQQRRRIGEEGKRKMVRNLPNWILNVDGPPYALSYLLAYPEV